MNAFRELQHNRELQHERHYGIVIGMLLGFGISLIIMVVIGVMQ